MSAALVVLSANPYGAKQLGYSLEELIGGSVLDVFHQDDAPAVRQQLSDCIKHLGQRGTWEVRKVRKDREVIWVRETARAVAGPSGLPLVLIVCEDITERKNADQKLLSLRDELEGLIVDRTGELRWKTAFLEAENNSTIDGILVIDPNHNKIYINRQLIALFKIPRYLAEEKNDENQLKWVTAKVKDRENFLERIHWLYAHPNETSRDEIELKDGTVLDRFSGPVVDDEGVYYGRIWTFRDITQIKRAERKAEEALQTAEEALKKEVVLRREMHHRVKNNLQIVISMLYLQSTKVSDPSLLGALQESQDRVRSLALVHQMLSQREDLTKVSFVDYLKQLTTDLLIAYRVNPGTVNLKLGEAGVFLSLDTAIPCGIIVTELITNALKYAFPEGSKGERTHEGKGEVEISLRPIEGSGMLALSVSDNGVGFPADLDIDHPETMGLRLVRDLTRQLGGNAEFRGNKRSQGTVVKVTFPEPKSVAG